jgi:hypothetical protein
LSSQEFIEQPQGFVYLIQGAGLVKIGWAVSPAKRLKLLQTGSPVLLELLGFIRGDQETEAYLHWKYARWRKHGEWFALTPSQINHILKDDEVARREGTGELVSKPTWLRVKGPVCKPETETKRAKALNRLEKRIVRDKPLVPLKEAPEYSHCVGCGAEGVLLDLRGECDNCFDQRVAKWRDPTHSNDSRLEPRVAATLGTEVRSSIGAIGPTRLRARSFDPEPSV